MPNEKQPSEPLPTDTEFRWCPPDGTSSVPIPRETIECLDRIERAIPGSRCTWFRVAGGEWIRNNDPLREAVKESR